MKKATKRKATKKSVGKRVRVAHEVAALEQMEGVIKRLLIVFQGMSQARVLVVSRASSQAVKMLAPTPLPPPPPVVREVEPWPLLKDNC